MYKSKVDTVPTHEETKIDENAEPPYYIILFKPWFKDSVSMLARVLGEDDDNLVHGYAFQIPAPLLNSSWDNTHSDQCNPLYISWFQLGVSDEQGDDLVVLSLLRSGYK